MIKVDDLDLVDGDGTSLKGFLGISYANLIKIFGIPHCRGRDGKTDAEWAYEYNDIIFTIYNYKNGPNYTGEGGVEDITAWNIGGHSQDAVYMVNDLLKSAGVEFKVRFYP